MYPDLLNTHFQRYPAMQLQDMYKLIHQAALGSEHTIKDQESVRNLLIKELDEMGGGPVEPLIDPISDDGNIVRVHLRPYLASTAAPETLMRAFFRTANEYRGSIDRLTNYLTSLRSLNHYPDDDVRKFITSMEQRGYPAVHHSDVFKGLYRPAYRVVYRDFLDGLKI